MKKLDERTELGIEILQCLDDTNFSRIEEIVKTRKRRLDEITEVENWNWLHKALCGSQKDLPPPQSIQYLIDNGNDVNAQDNYGMTPLHYALKAKNAGAAKVLLQAGANPNMPNTRKIIPLAYINGQPKELELLKLMLEKGGDINFNNGYETILEGIRERSKSEEVFKPVLEMMEKYA